MSAARNMYPSDGEDCAAKLKNAPKHHTLGSVIKSARQARNLTRSEASMALRISARYLAGIENENRKPSYDVLARIVQEFGISVDAILFPNSST